jgi:hypothetical protein
MLRRYRLILAGALAALLLVPCLAAEVAAPARPAPQLQAGEGLAVAGPDGIVHTYGEAKKEQPMGSLAKLVWLQLEGAEWAGQMVTFKCTGTMGPYHCWLRTGHGRVDLAKATQESCNLAFLAWALGSVEAWKRTYGEGAARARLEDAFRPFLGYRLREGDTLPEVTPEWVGDGTLLRTTPEDMLKWLMDADQAELMARCRRLLLNFFVESFVDEAWWMKTGTAPVPSDPGATSAWVVGSNGSVTAVLHLPRGRGKAEGLNRFREIMGLPVKKK